MTARAGAVCSQPGCPQLRPCPVAGHEPERVRFHRRRSPKRVYGATHRSLREQVFERDGYRCADASDGTRCGSTERLQLGHRDRLGPDTPGNCFAQCRRCNLRQAQRESQASREGSAS